MERSELLTACVAGVMGLGILAGNVVASRRPATDVTPAVAEKPKIPAFIAAQVPPEGCHQRSGDPVRTCEGEVMLWGDSMAWAWSPLGTVANSRDNCPPLLGYQPGAAKYHVRCREFNDETLAKAKNAKRVILAGAWTFYPLGEIQRGLGATLRQIPHATIMGPTPTLRGAMPECMAYGVAECAVPRAIFEREAEPVREVLKALAAKHGATYVEPVDYFCTATECPALKDGLPLYWDARHVSVSAVEGFRAAQ